MFLFTISKITYILSMKSMIYEGFQRIKNIFQSIL